MQIWEDVSFRLTDRQFSPVGRVRGCGMRISELLQLPLDCLTQDARGTFYLRFMQGKMKREHTIPVSHEITRVLQEQQQVVRATGHSTTLLFPNSKGGVSSNKASHNASTAWRMTIKSATPMANSFASSHISFATPSERE